MNISEIITLIRSGSSNPDHREGQRQIEEAIGLLKGIQVAGQWQTMENAEEEDGFSILAYDEAEVNEKAYGYIHQTYYSSKDGLWHLSCNGEIWNPTCFIPMPAPPNNQQQTKLESES
jgi:hypothetical protein